MSDQKSGFSFSNLNLRNFAMDSTLVFGVIIIIIIMMLIIPMPEFMLDFLMSLSMLSGIIIVLTVAYLRKAVDFSIFPSLLLVTTIFRLAINVSSTRLILSKGANFQGRMVRAFGQFVVGTTDSAGLVIGIIIFAILVIVQFIVITRGATRVSEVAARFSLDSMPNKYMAIDMDVQNGVIDETEAIRRRAELQEESSFYGNMDGASKFIQGDVIVGIIITLVNIIGGFVVGMAVRGETLDVAVQNYITLTVGDGLVSQIPSLLISFSTGLIVTRSQAKDAIGASVWKQISSQYRVFFIAAGALAVMSILPGFPHIILLILAVSMAGAGFALYRAEKNVMEGKEKKAREAQDQPKGPEDVSSLLKVDPLTLYIGYELIPYVDKNQNAELLNSLAGIRRNLALDLGIIVPPIRIQDNIRLSPNEYSFKIRGQEVGSGYIKTGYMMAMGEGAEELDGEQTTEPAFGLPAYWIREDSRDKAENLGYTVVDGPTIISTHIQELLKSHAYEILGREETNQIISTVRQDYPNVVDDVVKDYSKSVLQRIFQNLLKEGIPVRDMPTILETLSEHDPNTPIFTLLEFVRQSLKRAICSKYKNVEDKLFILRIHPQIENEIYKNIENDKDGEPIIRLKPEVLNKIQLLIRDKVSAMFEDGHIPVIITQPVIRRAVWEICQYINRNIAVLSTRELIPDIEIVLFDQITLVKEQSTTENNEAAAEPAGTAGQA
ncbi:MAG: flagellar biosynthesis protein FlhA [Spirochaetes bacterium]|nr:flagellar biosynthesis protein FlhA [Spirochaetota bacterium]